jgi:putative RecB family exonuclease
MAADWLGLPFSVSKLSTFRKCPKRFWYKYVKSKKEGFKTVEAFLGEVVHVSLGWLYGKPKEGANITKRSLLRHFLDTWERHVSPSVKIVRPGDSYEHYRARGVHMLDQYFERIFLKDHKQTLEVEHEFELLLKKRHRLAGRIDRVAVDADGDIFVIDYKTSKRGAKGLDEDSDLQLDVYGLWALLKKGVDRVYLRCELLQDSTKYTLGLKRRDAHAVVDELVARIGEVRQETAFAARPSPLCDWCGYHEMCPDRWQGKVRRQSSN